jgi:hypothetical protein
MGQAPREERERKDVRVPKSLYDEVPASEKAELRRSLEYRTTSLQTEPLRVYFPASLTGRASLATICTPASWACP